MKVKQSMLRTPMDEEAWAHHVMADYDYIVRASERYGDMFWKMLSPAAKRTLINKVVDLERELLEAECQ